jgi:hypothetical protein
MAYNDGAQPFNIGHARPAARRAALTLGEELAPLRTVLAMLENSQEYRTAVQIIQPRLDREAEIEAARQREISARNEELAAARLDLEKAEAKARAEGFWGQARQRYESAKAALEKALNKTSS